MLEVKNLPVNAGDRRDGVWSLGGEDPLEEGMATHFSILAWRIPWTEESGRLQSIGFQRVGHDWSDLTRMHIAKIMLSFAPSATGNLFASEIFLGLSECDTETQSEQMLLVPTDSLSTWELYKPSICTKQKQKHSILRRAIDRHMPLLLIINSN